MTPFLYLSCAHFSVSKLRKILLLLAVILLSACSDPTSNPKSEYQNLSEKPPLSVIPFSNTSNESIISTRLSIPLTSLRAKLEEDIPESLYNDPGKIKQKCIRIFGKDLCETYQVGGWAHRTGPIQLVPLNNGYLRIAIPLEYKLKVRGKGKIVKEMLRNIDFKKASFTAIADLRPHINESWQLQLAANSTIHWNQSPRVKILGVDLDIQNKVEKPILKALDKALKKQQAKMASDNRLRKSVEKFWLSLQQPRKLKGPFPLWLKATPNALNLSTVSIDHTAIQVGLSLRTQLTTSGNSEPNNTPIPLPALRDRLVENSTLNLSLPLALSYADMALSLQQRLTKKPLAYKQGNTSIAVKSVEIYPNNDRLVLAAKVKISGLAKLLTSDGEIFISGKPVIDNHNKILRLADVAFSRKLDSLFWSTATSLLHKQLLSGLQKALVFDFSQDYQALYQSINQQLQGQHGKNLTLHGQLYSLEIRKIQPDLDELRLILEAQGVVDLELR